MLILSQRFRRSVYLKLQRGLRRIGSQENRTGYLFMLPLLLIMIFLLGYPVISAFLLTFHEKVIGRVAHFIGLKNYYELLFQDPKVREVALNTFSYTTAAITGKLALGMILALLLNQVKKGRGLIGGLLLIPWAIPTIVRCLTWRRMFDYSAGIINYLMINAGLIDAPIAWIGDVLMAKIAVIAVNIWGGTPFFMICLLAGLQAIPTELYEAAKVDGAGTWHRFRYITVPSLKTITLITVLLSTVWTFNGFEQIWLLTLGGPGNATDIFVTYAYKVGLQGVRLGYGATISTILLPLIFLVVIIVTPHMLGGTRK